MVKIICIIGARPQFIKHFPLEIELRKFAEVISIHTGQHYDESMSDIFFNELNISKPDYHLKLEKNSHAGQTAEMLIQIEEILMKEAPNFVLVYGDTNSTIAGALSAAKLGIRIIHVEAGLRSYNRSMPEEINRVLTDHLSTFLFCSSLQGIKCLEKEGITSGVFLCGDLMRDSLFLIHERLKNDINQPYLFATFHRPYNTDNPERLVRIINALNQVNKKIIFPVHPRTRKILENQVFDFSAYANIDFIQPVGYVECLKLQKFSDCIITDSGGIQKEAYWLMKKCITIRSETEWVETLLGNWNQLVFENLDVISDRISQQPDMASYQSDLYGKGESAKLIAQSIYKNSVL